MSQRNKNNSIIFLTTLSVYLGLVLVGGAASPVLAQNPSLTFEERLGQDPELRRIVEECGKILPRIQRKGYGEDIALSYSIDEFVNALIDLSAHSICLAPESFGYTSEISSASPKYLVSSFYRYKPMSKVTWTSGVLTSHTTAIGNSLPRTRKSGETYFQIDFELDKTTLSCIAKFKQDSVEQAKQTAELYEISLKDWQVAKRNTPESAIYENTKISSENNQVFIVTRLPRGSLDKLLKNAKAESK